MSSVLDRLPCFPCLDCQSYAFATKLIFLLTLCNLGLFVSLMLHLNEDADTLDAKHTTHTTSMVHQAGSADWDMQEHMADLQSYSNIWFVLTPGIYAILISPDYSVKPEGFVQLQSENAKSRGLGVLALCVVVALVSTFKHAFEASTMFPGDATSADNDVTAHRIYCELTSGAAFEQFISGNRSAAYVYACLPAYWAVKIDWLVARFTVYAVTFMASGFPEAIHVLWAKKHPHYHALAQTLAFSALGACVLMDIIQTVQSTNESSLDLALNSVIWSSPAVLGPWFVLVLIDEDASQVAKATLKDDCLNLRSRMFLISLNVGMGYVAWEWPDDTYRLAHMGWHFFSGVAALGALTLTVDWEGRFIDYTEKKPQVTLPKTRTPVQL